VRSLLGTLLHSASAISPASMASVSGMLEWPGTQRMSRLNTPFKPGVIFLSARLHSSALLAR
jgi:hypothetical protein